MSCTHPVARVIPGPVLGFVHALGVETCPDCDTVTGIRGKQRMVRTGRDVALEHRLGAHRETAAWGCVECRR